MNLGHVQEAVHSGRSQAGSLSGLSEEAFNAELRIHSATSMTPPSYIPNASGSARAVHGHIAQNIPLLATYGMPFQVLYMYPLSLKEK